MTDMRFYYPKVLEQFTKACPRITFMLAAPVELLEQYPDDMIKIISQTFIVAPETVIVPVPAQLLV
jgi:hypothetical protein